jgi:phosphohistidine phosphatase
MGLPSRSHLGHTRIMRVILLRHGIAWDRADPACPPDPERPLTEEGHKKTRKVAKGLVRLGVKPTRVLTSPYERARQTAAIVTETCGLAPDHVIVTDSLLPEAAPYAIFHALHAFAHTDAEIVCVGHAPHLDRALALSITGDKVPVTSLKKAGAALLEVDDLPRLHGELVWLMPPKVLAELG